MRRRRPDRHPLLDSPPEPPVDLGYRCEATTRPSRPCANCVEVCGYVVELDEYSEARRAWADLVGSDEVAVHTPDEPICHYRF